MRTIRNEKLRTRQLSGVRKGGTHCERGWKCVSTPKNKDTRLGNHTNSPKVIPEMTCCCSAIRSQGVREKLVHQGVSPLGGKHRKDPKIGGLDVGNLYEYLLLVWCSTMAKPDLVVMATPTVFFSNSRLN